LAQLSSLVEAKQGRQRGRKWGRAWFLGGADSHCQQYFTNKKTADLWNVTYRNRLQITGLHPAPSDSVIRALCTNLLTYLLTYPL